MIKLKELNNEAKMLAHKLGIVDRVEKYNTKNCFITIKDHKSNFKSQISRAIYIR